MSQAYVVLPITFIDERDHHARSGQARQQQAQETIEYLKEKLVVEWVENFK